MDPLNVRKQKTAHGNSTCLSSSSGCGAVAPDDLEDKACKLKRRKKRRSLASAVKARALAKKAFAWCALILGLASMLWLFLEVRDHHKHSISPRKLSVFKDTDLFKAPPVEKPTNLDNLDMPMRNVAGMREPCLKLRPFDALLTLKLPPPTNTPVKSLHYKVMGQWIGKLPSRDILFSGNQTMEEREESFKLSDTMEVHCGFWNDGVFTLTNEDKIYLESCEVVVATCNFGGGDGIYHPINMTNASISKVCYVAFWDKVTLETLVTKGITMDRSRKIGRWRIILVENLPFSDQRLNGKIPKMLGHRLFLNAKFSIWVDSKSQFRRDPLGVLEALLWRANSTLAISQHGARDCIYKEGQAIVKKNKATPEEVAKQLHQYRTEGFPERAMFNGHKALAEASVIIREHTPLTNLFMCLWFNEVTRFTARDQLSFPYVLRRMGLLHVNMFPVCTRKALLNSIGHMSKAKYLDTLDDNF